MKNIHTLYLGGTFGCTGTPLKPLPEKDFFFSLNNYLAKEYLQLDPVEHPLTIQDSSQITSQDFQDLYEFIKDSVGNYESLLIIHGTDTLSYIAAFIAYVFSGYDINIVFLASMVPLLSIQDSDEVNLHSDALQNLFIALNFITKSKKILVETNHTANVFMAIDGKLLPAINTLKTHRSQIPAFHTNSVIIESETKRTLLNHSIDFEYHIADVNIRNLYCMPTSPRDLSYQLDDIVQKKPDAIILIGYGAGNFFVNESIMASLKTAYLNGILVVITSQVPFGSVSNDYQAGNWLNTCYVLSGYDLSVPSIYAKLLFICAKYRCFKQRLELW